MPTGIYKHQPHSEETKRKISLASRGPKPEGFGEKISRALRGRRLTEKIRRRMSKSKMGHIVTKETREKIGKANMIASKGKTGELASNWKGGKPNCIDCGKQLSIYHGKRCDQCSRKFSSGKNHYNWQGGITPENVKIRNSIEFRLWRESVFARDNWTCQKCKVKGGKLHSHHIKNFAEWPELRFAIDNGITLCKKCHKKFHEKYGRNKNTLEQLQEFLKERIKNE